MTQVEETGGKRGHWAFAAGGLVVFVILLGLGTWQVERLHWKEGLLAKIEERIHAKPVHLNAIVKLYSEGVDVEYRPVTVRGTFVNSGERHFLSTWQGQSGFDVHTPLRLANGRYVFVNRGFVPYDRKDPATRESGQLQGEIDVTGLTRTAPAEKPSFVVPENTPDQNVFYWKDLRAMAATAGLPEGANVLPFYVDANDTPNPGGLPVGGVTIIDLPNNHLQYAVTWYGLAAVLLVVMTLRLWPRRREGQ